jgi:Raf kinase inhibitor-like YbhB/YbcL family protein
MRDVTRKPLAALMLASLILVSCPQQTEETQEEGGVTEGTQPTTELDMEVTSSAFADGADIPPKYSCEGDDVSPPLTWTGVPEEATGLALIVDDPDAPGATFYHWAIWEIPPDVTGLDEGTVPPEALQGTNDADVAGYRGPCPPPPDPAHQYRFTLIAHEGTLDVEAGAPASEVLEAAAGAELARGLLTGRYDR